MKALQTLVDEFHPLFVLILDPVKPPWLSRDIPGEPWLKRSYRLLCLDYARAPECGAERKTSDTVSPIPSFRMS